MLLFLVLCSRDTHGRGRSPVPSIQKFYIPAHQAPPPQATLLTTAHPPPAQPAHFGPFSPGSSHMTAAPPPAHQSPRHMHYGGHPLPAHLHHMLPSAAAAATLHPGAASYPTTQLHPQMTGPAYVNSPTCSIYTAYPLSPTKTRPYQYLYQAFE